MIRLLSKATVRGTRVLLRVDFNVPIRGRRVIDDFRIRQTLPTIRRLLANGNSIVFLAHHSNHRQTLAPVAAQVSRLIRRPIMFIRNPFTPKAAERAGEQRLFFLENLRFWPGEELSALSFAKDLAAWGAVFVNDAFGVAHRRAASVSVLPHLMSSRLGLLFEKELKGFDRVLVRPKRPLVAIFGGAKIKTKIPILRRFIRLADSILVGGAIANVLFRHRGFTGRHGKTPKDRTAFGHALRVIARSRKVILPTDAVVAPKDSLEHPTVRSIDEIRPGEVIYDIGPKSEQLFRAVLQKARTVVWNGPVGLVEVHEFARGTRSLARTLSRSRAEVHVGGGDTIAFLDRIGLLARFHHVSTGGGAMLTYLAGEKLPALEALKR